MQAIALRPQRRQLAAMVYGVAACVVSMALFPALCLPLGLCLPLFACPLIGTGKQWAAVGAVFAAPLVSLIFGASALYACSLLLACGAPVSLTFVLEAKERTGKEIVVYYIAAYALALAAALACLRSVAGGANGFAGWITNRLMASPDANELLYRLAAAGFISVPRAYRDASQISFFIDPVLVRQMTLSLRLTVEIYVEELLPALIVQCCLLGGVFTAFRTQKLHHSYLLVDEQHKERVKMAVVPGFSAFTLPKGCVAALLAAGVLSLALSSADGAWFQTLSRLLFAAFEGAFELLGAAALVGLMLTKRPEARFSSGLLVAAMYALVPLALLMLGLMDSFLHFRENDPLHKKEEDEQ